MKTAKRVLFFGGFFLFFNLSRVLAAPVNESSETAIRSQIYKSLLHSPEWQENPGSVDVEFSVGPDSQVQVIDVKGGNQELQKFVKEKLSGVKVSNEYANEHYTVRLTFKLI